MLLGLNTVCDVYFTGALEVMVEEWNIKPDVAGATFMAAGGSAPEFFTSLIGTTWVISDVGFSTIVGSAVFNVLFVIGLCGFVAQGDIKLTWWPLFRDCTYYIIGLSLLAFFASDQKIGLLEAVILFAAYIVYCIIMYFNPTIEALVDSKVRMANKQGRKVMPLQETESGSSEPGTSATVGQSTPSSQTKLDNQSSESTTCKLSAATNDTSLSAAATSAAVETVADASSEGACKSGEVLSFGDGDNITCAEPAEVREAVTGTTATCTEADPPTTEPPAEKAEDAEEDKEEEEEEEEDECFMDYPTGRANQIIWFMSLPMYLPLYYLVPWPRKERRMFVATFALSLLWIAGFAFLLVWWVHTLGQVLGIKDVIMNFTLLAMGTSIPDAASSVAVARKGEGDMAVSSSIGSNVFDILVGLPVPWIIKILIEGGKFDHQVTLFSDYLTFYVILLLGMVFSVILSIHLLGWRLNKALGAAMAVLYLIFLAIAIYVEIETPEALKT